MDGLHLVHNEVNQLIFRVTETFVHWSVNKPGVVCQVQDLPSSDKTKEPKKFYCFDLHNSAPSSLPQRAAFFFEVANNTLGRQFRESNDFREKDTQKKKNIRNSGVSGGEGTDVLRHFSFFLDCLVDEQHSEPQDHEFLVAFALKVHLTRAISERIMKPLYVIGHDEHLWGELGRCFHLCSVLHGFKEFTNGSFIFARLAPFYLRMNEDSFRVSVDFVPSGEGDHVPPLVNAVAVGEEEEGSGSGPQETERWVTVPSSSSLLSPP